MMIVRAIVNSISGTGKLKRKLDKLGPVLRDHGYLLEIFKTRQPGDITRWAASAPDNTRAVITVGGDGTIREAVEALANTDVPLILLPGGTENIVAKHFGFPDTVAGILENIKNGVPTVRDVGIVNGGKFFTVVGVGFDAEAVHRVASARKGHISHATWVDPIWRTFWTHKFPRVAVTVDGETVFEDAGMVFIANLPRYSANLRLCGDARSDDGLLDVCVYPCQTRARLIGHAARTFLRRHVGRDGVLYFRGKNVRVESLDPNATVPVEADGDPAGQLPINCSVLPGAVRLLLPPVRNKTAIPA